MIRICVALFVQITAPSYLLACSAVPDAGRMALHGRLAAEGACVLCMLRDFDLLDLFSEGGTVAAHNMSVVDLGALFGYRPLS